ncbi:hypothetical protein JTB14_006609 [Gonioctena quinquepunctata]|nr:hypothetical protein JTB14_006609 [Gonioctena quinquepunctata]
MEDSEIASLSADGITALLKEYFPGPKPYPRTPRTPDITPSSPMSCSPVPHYFSPSLFPTVSECPPTPTIQSINEVKMVTQNEFGKSPGILLLNPTPTQDRRPEARIQILSNHLITPPPPGGILEQEAQHIQGLLTQYTMYLKEGTSPSGWDPVFVNALRRLRPPSVPKNRRCRIRLTDGLGNRSWVTIPATGNHCPLTKRGSSTRPEPRINTVPPVYVIMNPWRVRNTTPWSSECEGAAEYWKDPTDLRNKLTIQRKESRKLDNHGTQTFKIPSGSKPAARSGGSRWSTAANQHATGIRWPLSDAPQASLLLERIRRVKNSVPPPRRPPTTPPPVIDDCPRYLLVDKDLCWRCGHLGHKRQSCRKP